MAFAYVKRRPLLLGSVKVMLFGYSYKISFLTYSNQFMKIVTAPSCMTTTNSSFYKFDWYQTMVWVSIKKLTHLPLLLIINHDSRDVTHVLVSLRIWCAWRTFH